MKGEGGRWNSMPPRVVMKFVWLPGREWVDNAFDSAFTLPRQLESWSGPRDQLHLFKSTRQSTSEGSHVRFRFGRRESARLTVIMESVYTSWRDFSRILTHQCINTALSSLVHTNSEFYSIAQQEGYAQPETLFPLSWDLKYMTISCSSMTVRGDTL